MTPSDNASEQAKARLAALFADPAQQHPDPRAIAETLHGQLDDPKQQGKPFDPGNPGKWHQTPDGNWHSPDYPDEP